jgi:hypothetical protein
MSPLLAHRPVHGNGDPLIELHLNAFNFGRILQRPTRNHLWNHIRSGVGYPASQQLPWQPARGHTRDVASPTKNPTVRVSE